MMEGMVLNGELLQLFQEWELLQPLRTRAKRAQNKELVEVM